jgi:lipoate-protein ligase A
MQRQKASVSRELDPRETSELAIQGDTDLALHNRKFSGNAQRRKIRSLLFHGTFLHHLNSDYNRYLRFPSRQPPYRAGREHSDFMTGLNIPTARLAASLRETWEAAEIFAPDKLPLERVSVLVREKYSNNAWNLRL